jgi:hypothetical protein
MKNFTLYRIAACLLVLFFAGHTGGGMLAQKSVGVAGDTVFVAMKEVHFDFNGSSCTWYGFWFGFGLMVSAFLILSAVIAWKLDAIGPQVWPAVSTIAWMLVASQAFNAILAWRYFFVGPGVLATTITALLGVATWRKQTEATGARPS